MFHDMMSKCSLFCELLSCFCFIWHIGLYDVLSIGIWSHMFLMVNTCFFSSSSNGHTQCGILSGLFHSFYVFCLPLHYHHLATVYFTSYVLIFFHVPETGRLGQILQQQFLNKMNGDKNSGDTYSTRFSWNQRIFGDTFHHIWTFSYWKGYKFIFKSCDIWTYGL